MLIISKTRQSELGIKYAGVQMTVEPGPWAMGITVERPRIMYHDLITGSTFMVGDRETIEQAVERIRKPFLTHPAA